MFIPEYHRFQRQNTVILCCMYGVLRVLRDDERRVDQDQQCDDCHLPQTHKAQAAEKTAESAGHHLGCSMIRTGTERSEPFFILFSVSFQHVNINSARVWVHSGQVSAFVASSCQVRAGVNIGGNMSVNSEPGRAAMPMRKDRLGWTCPRGLFVHDGRPMAWSWNGHWRLRNNEWFLVLPIAEAMAWSC